MNEPAVMEADREKAIMNDGAPAVRRDFLLKQIENEVNAAFAFVADARNAYNQFRPAEGDAALMNALLRQQMALKHVSESDISRVRAITHQLTELRQAVELLRETLMEQHGGVR